MAVVFVDLDNTLIYSYKHDIGTDKRNVEIYQGREVSFMTNKTHALLLELKKYARIVPATTRTIEQYSRIDLGIGPVKYALACNGGVLLADGKKDAQWQEQSKALVQESRPQLLRAVQLLEQDAARRLEVRFIEELFVFTKSALPEKTAGYLKKQLDRSLVDVFLNGEKVYVVPKALNKGKAAARFLAYIGEDTAAAAGDSAFDLPMLEQADFAAAPCGYACAGRLQGGHVSFMAPDRIFSEAALEFIINRLAACAGCRKV